MPKTYKYKAFISYSHQDKAFAKWLHKGIENYKIPKQLREKYPHLPQNLKRSIFRDDEELSSALVLSDALKVALEESENLIVVCSPKAVKSKWVAQEIEHFQEVHKGNIFSIIKKGVLEDVCPLALTLEVLAVDATAVQGRKRALVKMVAAILDVDFADLWEREKKEEKKRWFVKGIAFALFLGISIYAYMLFTALSSNRELLKIEDEIAHVTHKLEQKDIKQDEAYTLSRHLKQLEEMKILKEDTLKWFGILHTSVAKRAKEAYNAKGVDEALRMLESSNSLREDEVYAKKNMLRAKLYVEKGEYKKASHFYEKAIVVDDGYENLYDYALFLMKQHQDKKAKRLFERLEAYELGDVQRANVLNRLGILYRKSGQMQEAQKVYMAALELRKELAVLNPKRYQNDLAWTYNNLGVLYKENNQSEASQKAHFKAFELRKALKKENPKVYTFHVSCSRHNLGELYSSMQQTQKAETFFKASLQTRRSLAQKNPEKYIPPFASTLYELASLYSVEERNKEAEKYYLEALELRRILARNNPNAYSDALIDTLDGLAKLYMKMQETNKADELYVERDKLVKEKR